MEVLAGVLLIIFLVTMIFVVAGLLVNYIIGPFTDWLDRR